MYKLILFSLISLALLSCSTKEEGGTSLTLNTTSISDVPVKITLPRSDSALATGVLEQGSVRLDFTLDYPQMVEVKIEGIQQPINFFADQAAMSISIDGTQMPPSFEVSGSKYQDSLMAFGAAEQALQNYMNSFRQPWEQADAANDSLTMFVIRTKADSAYQDFESYKIDFAARNGILGAMIMQRFVYMAELNDVERVYDNILVEHRNAPIVEDFKERLDILKNTQIGMRFTDITQQDTLGNQMTISNIEAKYLLIDFWASWCGPCRQANPELVKIYNDFHGKGFDIVGVSLDQKRDAWIKGINEDGLMWHQMSDLKGWQNQGAAAYAIRSIPQSIIIDDEGFIVNKNLTPDQLRAFLTDNL